ncbi:MAG: adenosylcobinamide-GDP ribazoletransferase, partial [Holophaga sp.]|nr:adenosylcobinamide-GDP ribazoletransferase [Holophaga sp.]
MRSLIAAIRFLTRIPVPGPDTHVEDISRAVGWFPLVGAGVGAATAGIFIAGLKLWPAPAAALLAVAAGLMLTGGFHEDGATDATDGLGGGWTRERVLEIMKDSRIGAYGAMALWCLL